MFRFFPWGRSFFDTFDWPFLSHPGEFDQKILEFVKSPPLARTPPPPPTGFTLIGAWVAKSDWDWSSCENRTSCTSCKAMYNISAFRSVLECHVWQNCLVYYSEIWFEFLQRGLEARPLTSGTTRMACKTGETTNISLRTLRPRPNVELFMRRTKLTELSKWKVQRLAQLSSSEWVWIVQKVLPIGFKRIERLKIVSAGTNVDIIHLDELN